jgi:hypothetical protein
MIAPPAAGRTLGRRWELRSALGEGPGRVEYRAFDRDGGGEVDLWWLRPELFPDEARRRRLASAAPAIRRAVFPSLRVLVAVGQDEGHLVCAWQAASGPGLEPQPGAVPLEVLATWFDAVASGLAALHGQGLVHGRLSPRDVVAMSGRYLVGGAGLWTDVEPAAAARAWRDRELYLAPEVRDGDPPTAAADAFSLGAMAAVLIAGGATSHAEAMRVAAKRHPALHEVLVSLTSSAPELRRADLAAAAADVRAAAATPYAPAGRGSAPVLAAPPAHPAFAPLTPGALTDVAVHDEAVAAPPDPRLDAPTDPDPERSGTVVGHAPAPGRTGLTMRPPAPVAPPVAPVAPAPPAVLRAVSMKPPEPPRVAAAAPARPPARVRRISAAMARSFSTAPGALGYLAPPKSAADERADRPRNLGRWLLAAAAIAGAGAAAYLALRAL